MLVVLMLALAGPGPQTINQPRKNYAACLSAFEKKSRADKMDPAAYAMAAKTACPAEAAALTAALVAFDVGMGSKRAAAQASAAADLADYVITSEERYRDTMAANRPQ